MATTDASGPPRGSVTLALPPSLRISRGRCNSSPNEDGGLWFPSDPLVTSACWESVSLSLLRLYLFFGLLCPCPLSPSGCLSQPLTSLPEDPLHLSPAPDRTTCPSGRASLSLRVIRSDSGSRGQPCRLPRCLPPRRLLSGSAPPPPSTLSRPRAGGSARTRIPRTGTHAQLAHAPAALPRGVSAHAQSPMQRRPAGAPGGQLAARLGWGGAACARAQKGGRSISRQAEEKAARRAEVGARPARVGGGGRAAGRAEARRPGAETAGAAGPGGGLSSRPRCAEGGDVGAWLRGLCPRPGARRGGRRAGPGSGARASGARSRLPGVASSPRTERRPGRDVGPGLISTPPRRTSPRGQSQRPPPGCVRAPTGSGRGGGRKELSLCHSFLGALSVSAGKEIRFWTQHLQQIL